MSIRRRRKAGASWRITPARVCKVSVAWLRLSRMCCTDGLSGFVSSQLHYTAPWWLPGGNAQTIAFAELVMAMKQGVVDGQENPVGTIYDLKIYETQKYMSILNYTYSSMVHVVNKKSWDKLTPEQQKIVTEESAAAAKQARKLLRDNEAVQLKDLETTKGIVIARPDLGPWKAAMGPAWDKVKARVGADNFKRFMDMVEKNSK